MSRATGLALAAAVALAPLAGCHGAQDGATANGGATSASAAGPAEPPVPVDHLAPGELLPGVESAFGVALPQGVHIERQGPYSVRAMGQVGLHPFVKFLRGRLKDATLTEGDAFATFEHVKLAVKPAADFRFKLSAMPAGNTLVEADDVTPPPAQDLPDEAARWKAVGLTPEGKILDPTHLQ